jgi:hypothetical protein
MKRHLCIVLLCRFPASLALFNATGSTERGSAGEPYGVCHARRRRL